MFQVWPKRPCDGEFVLHMDDQISGHGFLPVYTGKNKPASYTVQ